MERISREHDVERRRLELLFQVEKARQQEELRKRKEKKRRERLLKKKPNKEESDAAAEEDELEEKAAPRESLPAPVLSARLLSPRSAPVKAETKTSPQDDSQAIKVLVPGHGRVDLSHLLGDSHAKRSNERKGLPSSTQQQQLPTQAMLNPSTLRYLMERMMKRDPANWGHGASKHEFVVDGMAAADEK